MPAETKRQVLSLLEEEARVLRESDPAIASALVSALDVLDVMASDETALRSTTDDDAEWLLRELSRRR
ncbi:MAG: hypothetical protein Q8L14_21120 [Myxococcales bacterium]|nr:hypothetical protein [Myxococcales bacterium]